MKRPIFRLWIYPAISGIIILVLWYALSQWMGPANAELLSDEQVANIRKMFMPYPNEVWAEAMEEKSLLWTATINTFQAAVLGFLSAVITGLLIALLLASSKAIKRGVYPWVLVLQMTPIVILAPIIAIWFDQGLFSIMVVSFLMGFFPIVANTTLGLTSTDQNLKELFAISKASKFQELLFLRIPFALPHFLTGAKIAATLAPIGAIVGDMFVGTSANGQAGLGFLTLIFRDKANVPAVYACAAIACVMGFLFVGLITYLQWLLLHRWHDSAFDAES